MKLNEFYDSIGGGYESVKLRLPKDELIEKFVFRFLSEPSYGDLRQSLEEEKYVEAFRAAHSLKGVCANLAFQRLETSSGSLTELLRIENEIDKAAVEQVFRQVTKDYTEVMDAVRNLVNA